ncbi:MAG: hypothetical protein JW757_10475 [Anaerolineales bacterium]|nr:hypothetical protein [Anaerolineales bacterium]
MEQALHWLVGALGVPLINWLKDRFGLSGRPAVWLTLAVSLVLGVVSLLVSDELNWADFAPENLLAVVGQVLAAATLAYKLLGGSQSPE